MSSKTVSAEKGEKINGKKGAKKSEKKSVKKSVKTMPDAEVAAASANDTTSANDTASANDIEVLPGEGEKKQKKCPARGSDGRFVKGSSPPKSPGRPKKPEELKKLMPSALKTIERILNSKDGSERVKLDAAKWVVEMNIGKAPQQVDANFEGHTNLSAVVLNFEGELEEWSG